MKSSLNQLLTFHLKINKEKETSGRPPSLNNHYSFLNELDEHLREIQTANFTNAHSQN